MAENRNSSKVTGMVFVVTFFLLFAVNALVLFVANMFFPAMIVLGTMSLTLPWSIAHSMGALALIGTLIIPFVRKYEINREKMFNSAEWMLAYFLINLAGVWLIARFPDQFGLGISSWLVAVALAVVLDFVSGMAMMRLEKYRSKLL